LGCLFSYYSEYILDTSLLGINSFISLAFRNRKPKKKKARKKKKQKTKKIYCSKKKSNYAEGSTFLLWQSKHGH
jgi:hypothetical protein